MIASRLDMVPNEHYLLIEIWFHYHIIVDLEHKYSYHLFGCSWMVVHVWKLDLYIKEVD